MQLGESIRLTKPSALGDFRVRPHGSKSITNRAVLLAAVADGPSRLSGCLDSEDTQVMRECLRRLGVGLEVEDETTYAVVGAGAKFGADAPDATELFVGTAGTTARFLTAILTALDNAPAQRRLIVDGTPRMRERPMAGLLTPLREQGARWQSRDKDGFLPIEVLPARLKGGEIRLTRPASSQFISALVLAAGFAATPTRIVLEQGTPARPYVDMTLAVLEHFGGRAHWEQSEGLPLVLTVEPTQLKGQDYIIEPDASAASYFLGLATIYGAKVEIPDLGTKSLQGDAHFCHVLEKMGAKAQQQDHRTLLQGTGKIHGVELDLSDQPDMTLTAAVVALHADAPTKIRGVEILRHHECDRLEAGATELRKLGADVVEHQDGLDITPPATINSGVEIDTYDDHRMAMAFSMVGDVVIRDPKCAGKTFPRYFEELAKLGMVAS